MMVINPKLSYAIFISLILILFVTGGNGFAQKHDQELLKLEQAERDQKYQLDMNQYYIEKSLDLLLFDIYAIRDLSADKQAFETSIKELKEFKQKWFDSFLELWREYSVKRQDLMKQLPGNNKTLPPEVAKKLQGQSDAILAGLDEILRERQKKFDAEFTPLKNKVNLLLKDARDKIPLKDGEDVLPAKTYTSNAEWLCNNYLLSMHNASPWVFEDIGVRDTIRYLGYLGIDLLENNANLKIHDAATRKRTETYYDKLEPDLERFGIRQIFWPVSRHGPYPPEIGSCPPFREWSIFDPETLKCRKRQLDYAFKLFNKYPSFAGFQFDEVCSENKFLPEQAFPSEKYPEKQAGQVTLFKQYLEKKYDEAMLKELGLTEDKIRIPVYEDKKKNKVLWMEYQEFISDTDTRYWKQVYDYAHQLKPDCVVWMLFNAFWYAQNPFLHRWSHRIPNADVVDLAYWIEGSPSLSCYLDLLGANARGPVSYTPNPTRGGSAETLRREFAISTVHARANHFFALSIFFMNSSKTFLKSQRRPCDSAILVWKTLVEHCERIGKIQKYLIHTRSVWPVALVFSERSAVTEPSLAHLDNHLGLYRALAEEQIGFDTIFADTITPEQLKKYKVVILSDASTLRKEHIEAICDWVADGGFLITSGYSTLCDRWGRSLNNYQLNKVFGVDFVKLQGSGKPFAQMRMKGPYPVFCNMCQYDTVKPVTAEVRWKWETGEPAVTFNKYEKGACIFLSSRYPGRSMETPEGALIRGPRTHKYLQGFKRLLSESVLEGLKRNNTPPPLTAVKCPSYVELNLKIQEKPLRKIIHLINHSLDASPVKGVELALPMDKNDKAPKVFYGEDGAPVKVRSTDGSLVLSIRDFDVYDMVVIEP